MRFLCLLAAAFLSFMPLAAEPPKAQKLLPGLAPMPSLEFGLPASVIAGYQSERADLRSGLFWGSKEDLQAFFENQKLGRGPVIQVKMSNNVMQKSPTTFEGEELMVKDMTKNGYKNAKIKKLMWGKYPVLAFEGVSPFGDQQYMAWMGLNAPDGSSLRFTLTNGAGQKRADPAHVQAWEDFLAKTKEADKPAMKERPQNELGEGYTFAALGETSIKATAERRISDHRLLVLLEPLNEKTDFEFKRLSEASARWSGGKPIVKIYGELIYANGSQASIQEAIIPVKIKNVDNFTADSAKAQQNPRNIVIFR